MSAPPIMDYGIEEIWVKVFKKCGVYKHPIKLNAKEKVLQRTLLEAIETNPNGLPDNVQLSAWWDWYFAREDLEKENTDEC